MLNKFFCILTSFLLATSGLLAKEIKSFDQASIIKDADIFTEDGNINVEMIFDFSNLDINRNQTITLTPILKSKDEFHNVELEKIALTGNNKLLKDKKNNKDFSDKNFPVVLKSKDQNQTYNYIGSSPYEEWMNLSELIIKVEFNESDKIISNVILPVTQFDNTPPPSPIFVLKETEPMPEDDEEIEDRIGEEFNISSENTSSQYNTAIQAIQEGNYHQAAKYLSRLPQDPDMLNALGIVEYYNNNLPRAQYFFQRGAKLGSKEAVTNLTILEKTYKYRAQNR